MVQRFATTGHFGGKPFWFLWQAFLVSPVQQRMFVPLFPPDKLLIVVHFENSCWHICHTTSPYIVNASEMILSWWIFIIFQKNFWRKTWKNNFVILYNVFPNENITTFEKSKIFNIKKTLQNIDKWPYAILVLLSRPGSIICVCRRHLTLNKISTATEVAPCT